MEKNKIIILASIGIIAVAISLIVTQLLLIRKVKKKSVRDGKILLSYGILFSGYVIGFSILNFKTISIVNEFLDTIYKTNVPNQIIPIVKTSILFIGLTNSWLILLHFISKAFSPIFIGIQNDSIEIENDNYVYFLIKGVVFVSYVQVLMPLFEYVLRTFFPEIEIPYYR